jgi:hypothetical protein
MNLYAGSGEKLMHIFYRNNEIAGYSAVLHCLQIKGIDGLYGPRRKVVVFGWGAVSKGAISALRSRGFNNIHVYSKRKMHLVCDRNPDVYYHHLIIENDSLIILLMKMVAKFQLLIFLRMPI